MPEVIEAYGDVKIMRDEESTLPLYIVLSPKFSKNETSVVERPKALISNYREIIKELESFRTSEEKEAFLIEYVKKQLKEKGISSDNMDRIVTVIIDDVFLGYGRIGPLMRDEHLEEIMVNGVGIPAFVVHRKYGMCMTNIQYDSQDTLYELINWLSNYSGRKIDYGTPLLDAHMPDGSRANVAVSPAAPNGPSVTIRKFKKVPFNIIDLIKLKTLSVDLAAFLWLCVEGMGIQPCNILVAGGSGSGKTTMLNALAMFVPHNERIVTVEDTLELNFEFLENWVAMEANPSVLGKTRINSEALVENTLRMRPDRVIVGEVRGGEAYTLLVAMDIGLDGSMCTIHANTARDSTLRLMDEPMNIPIRMIPLIDVVLVMNRHFSRSTGVIRRVTEVAEIAGIEKDVVQLGDIYKWKSKEDDVARTEYPILLKERISERCSMSKKQLNAELFLREKVLEYMVKKNIGDTGRVIEMMHRYITNPKAVLSKINPKLVRYLKR
ncbi:MAG: Flp pilus assembly complex ATPase component TadA [Candidatus Altiarchaeota archaeon]|nr:Flp pilus assembly complex ATPase component TadA [Candidatus Altiarchaeota archaeon]MBU4406630.1 Flp pilus assembly complex ATPase component TadA [Candidatus Altiarchaeota archaeon]MBU4437900.1 Flp pilus assembly complex ATPase component TadA [Candidatus Altiarchaeota archaeon]